MIEGHVTLKGVATSRLRPTVLTGYNQLSESLSYYCLDLTIINVCFSYCFVVGFFTVVLRQNLTL